MRNSEIFRMHEMLLPVFWLIMHALGDAMMVHGIAGIVIVGIADMLVGGVFLAFVLSVAWFRGHMKAFWIILGVVSVLMLVGYLTVFPVSWLGLWASIIVSAWYAVIWWGTTNNAYGDDDERDDGIAGM